MLRCFSTDKLLTNTQLVLGSLLPFNEQAWPLRSQAQRAYSSYSCLQMYDPLPPVLEPTRGCWWSLISALNVVVSCLQRTDICLKLACPKLHYTAALAIVGSCSCIPLGTACCADNSWASAVIPLEIVHRSLLISAYGCSYRRIAADHNTAPAV